MQAAWFDRTDLSAHGFYKTPDITGWNGQKWQTRPFNYFTFGAAVSEVELDTLTGGTTAPLMLLPGSIPEGAPRHIRVLMHISCFFLSCVCACTWGWVGGWVGVYAYACAPFCVVSVCPPPRPTFSFFLPQVCVCMRVCARCEGMRACVCM